MDDFGPAEMAALVGDVRPPAVRWTQPERGTYSRAFQSVQDAIAAGRLTKAVPALFMRGETDEPERLGPGILRHLLDGTGSRWRYAWWTGNRGLLGASPELLFRLAPGRIETQAIAGTHPLAEAERLLSDPKEIAEHQSVVDDITTQLAPFGRVDAGPRELLALPDLAHLRTDISVRITQPLTFEDLVTALHPTAALGIAPRSAGLEVLRDLDQGEPRGRFGAPFGVVMPDGTGVCVVAIRNVQFEGRTLVLGHGGGVIRESRCDREWAELALKRDAVRRTLGL